MSKFTVPVDGKDMPSSSLMTLFYFLLILGGLVGLPLMLLTMFFSRRVFRHPVFVSFCLSGVLYSLSFTLLLFGGQALSPTPPYSLCLSQASMIYASMALVSTSLLTIELQLYFLVRRVAERKTKVQESRLKIVTLFVAPYAVFMALFTAAIAAGVDDPHAVQRSSYWCTFQHGSSAHGVSLASLVISLISTSATVIVQIVTVRDILKYWRKAKTTNVEPEFTTTFLIRLFALGNVLILISIICGLFIGSGGVDEVLHFIVGCVPLIIFLAFGTQRDMIRVWTLHRDHDEPGDCELPHHAPFSWKRPLSECESVESVDKFKEVTLTV